MRGQLGHSKLQASPAGPYSPLPSPLFSSLHGYLIYSQHEKLRVDLQGKTSAPPTSLPPPPVQGYLIYSQRKKLRADLQGKSQEEIRDMRLAGEVWTYPLAVGAGGWGGEGGQGRR